MIRGIVLKEKGEEVGTPDSRLYETSIETALMDHFIQIMDLLIVLSLLGWEHL